MAVVSYLTVFSNMLNYSFNHKYITLYYYEKFSGRFVFIIKKKKKLHYYKTYHTMKPYSKPYGDF